MKYTVVKATDIELTGEKRKAETIAVPSWEAVEAVESYRERHDFFHTE